MPEEGPLPEFLTALCAARPVVLTGHEHPDGDCVGAVSALYRLLTNRGTPVRVLFPDPPAASLDFVHADVPVEVFDPAVGLGACELLVLLDCSELGRLGAMAAAVRASGTRVAVIDHHVGAADGDGDLHYVDVGAAATGELVHRLFGALDVTPDPASATALFVALAADTGWFRYSNTDARVLAVASELATAGADVSRIFDLLNRRRAPDSVALLGELVAASRIELDGRLGLLAVTAEQIRAAERAGLDLDLAMEPLRSVAGVEVVVMLKPTPHGATKVSLRSQAGVDVQRIAKSFGGGGHQKAAGATVAAEVAAVAARVTAAVEQALATGGRA